MDSKSSRAKLPRHNSLNVEQVLWPALEPGDVMVTDNLSSQKVDGVRRLIESLGAELLCLPPYSPDLNPIEKAWATLKQLLRSAKAKTRGALEPAIGDALKMISPDNAGAVVVMEVGVMLWWMTLAFCWLTKSSKWLATRCFVWVGVRVVGIDGTCLFQP